MLMQSHCTVTSVYGCTRIYLMTRFPPMASGLFGENVINIVSMNNLYINNVSIDGFWTVWAAKDCTKSFPMSPCSMSLQRVLVLSRTSCLVPVPKTLCPSGYNDFYCTFLLQFIMFIAYHCYIFTSLNSPWL